MSTNQLKALELRAEDLARKIKIARSPAVKKLLIDKLTELMIISGGQLNFTDYISERATSKN